MLLAYGLPCQPAFQAYSSLGTTVPMIMPDNCGDPATLAAAGSAANGVYFVNLYKGSEVFPDDPDVKLYDQVMKAEKPDAADTDFSRGGFGTIMNIQALLNGMDPASLTHQSVLAAFKATNGPAELPQRALLVLGTAGGRDIRASAPDRRTSCSRSTGRSRS